MNRSIRHFLILVSTLTAGVAFAQEDKSHIGIVIDDRGVILKVDAASIAKRAGLKPGDKIISVNSQALEKISTDEIGRRVSDSKDANATFVIERVGKKYTCRLTKPKIDKSISTPASVSVSVPASASNKLRPKKDLPAILSSARQSKHSAQIEKEVVEALSIVPPSLLNELKDWGLKIKIVPSLIEDDSSLANQIPRGYTHGGGFDNCGGLFRGEIKTIYIAENVASGNQPYKRNELVHHTVWHELGHALDLSGGISTSQAFEEDYLKDKANLTNEQCRSNAYLVQEDQAGQSECFAELFVVLATNPNTERGKELASMFPRSFKYVRALVARPEAK